VIWILAWIPIATGLSIAFRPELSPTLLEVGAFLVAIWFGYVIRFTLLWALGMLSFWITRASAVFETVLVAELLLSGRLVPLSVMPAWVEAVASWLPFKWTFQFPIEVLIGRLTPREIVVGLGLQLVWMVLLGAIVALVWRRAVVKYTAVGS
jgi:ABC-2 type transport system permease protein